MPNQNAQPPSREGSAVEVDQVEAVETQQVGLYLAAILVEQAAEAT